MAKSLNIAFEEMWPFERPPSYIRALAEVPEHAQKVRAATETGEFLKARKTEIPQSCASIQHWKHLEAHTGMKVVMHDVSCCMMCLWLSAQ